jgi:two-component system response regulator HydG
MPVDLQGHLLRFLQDAQIVRVGGREAISVDVRIVSATNVRLREAIAEGRFREDLYYRLNVLTLPLPPLRERIEDIEPLARHFLQTAAKDFDRSVTDFDADALAVLRRHSWPGNVRELMSTVRRAVVIGDGDTVKLRDLFGIEDVPRPVATLTPKPLPRAGSNEERTALLAALARHGENVTLTAQELGVSRVTLYRMLRRHGVSLERGLKEPPITRGGSNGGGGSGTPPMQRIDAVVG